MKESSSADWRPMATGVGLTAATYVYFLIFAQFAFLHLVQSHVAGSATVRMIMGGMSVAGIAGSIFAGFTFTAAKGRILLLGSLVGCALAAGLTLVAGSVGAMMSVGLLCGGSLGILTVSLTAVIPLLIPSRHRGLCLGMGTGLAYTICNLPPVFAGTIGLQCRMAIVACALGILLAATNRLSDQSDLEIRTTTGVPASFTPYVMAFLALVWLDSAAFVILQATPALNRFGWGSAQLQESNAVIHLMAALFGGLVLDLGLLPLLLAMAWACLAVAVVMASAPSAISQASHWLYAGGVSFYSAALIFSPTIGMDGRRIRRAAARAGALYAIAGWGGSAFGIGMGQDLHRIPVSFLVVAGGVVLACSLAIKRMNTSDV